MASMFSLCSRFSPRSCCCNSASVYLAPGFSCCPELPDGFHSPIFPGGVATQPFFIPVLFVLDQQ